MFTRWMVAAAVLPAMLSVPAVAQAQDPEAVGRKGLVFANQGTNPTIGFYWQASDRVALRPDLSLSVSSTDRDDGADNENKSIGLGLTVMCFVASRDKLDVYVAPRFSYSRSTGETASQSTTSNSYSFTGSAGLQYRITSRISAFGEAGLTYSHGTSKSESPIGASNSTGNSYSSRSALGIVFFF